MKIPGFELFTKAQLIEKPFLLQEVLQLMESSFPPDERRSSDIWPMQLKFPAFKLWAVRPALSPLVAFLTWWEWDQLRYVEHFAVNVNERGKGIGALVFERFLCQSEKPLLLEVEPAVDDLSQRRIDFYRRLGLYLLGVNYKQPPYRIEFKPKDMLLMSSHAIKDETTLQEWISQLKNEVYKTELLE